MSSNHTHRGKHNLGLKRIENPLTTYPKSFAILSPYLFCLPTMSLITPYRPPSPVFSSLQRSRYTSINEHQHNADFQIYSITTYHKMYP